MTTNELPDEQNPALLYNCISKELLLQIAAGTIDPIQLAKQELKNRGYNEQGKWVGFK